MKIYISSLLIALLLYSQSNGDRADERTIIETALYASLVNDVERLESLCRNNDNSKEVERDLNFLGFATRVNLEDSDSFLTTTRSFQKKPLHKESKTFLKYLAATDVSNRVKQLKKEILYSKVSAIFNYASSSISNLLSGDTAFIGQLAADSIFFLFKRRNITARERKLTFYAKQMMRHASIPTDPEHEKLAGKIEKLEKKKRDTEINRNIRRIHYYLLNHNYLSADFFCRVTEELAETDKNLSNWRWNIATARGKSLRRRILDSEVLELAIENVTPNRKKEIRTTLAAVCCDDIATYSYSRERFSFNRDTNADSYFSLCDAAMAFREGEWQGGIQELTRVAKHSTARNELLAQGLLKTTWIDPYRDFCKQEKEYELDLWTYILTGKRPFTEHSYVSHNFIVREARQLAANLGAIIFTGFIRRGLQALKTNPLDPSEAKDAGVVFIRSSHEHGESMTKVKKVADWLGDCYSRDRSFSLARKYYATGNLLSERKEQKLLEREAEELFRLALNEEDIKRQKIILRSIMDHYPESRFSEKARREWETSNKKEAVLLNITYEKIRSMPVLAQSMGIPTALFDGDDNNGEMDEEGITLRNDGNAIVTDTKTAIELVFELEPEQIEKAKTLYNETALREQNETAKDEILRKRKFPVEIMGSAGTGGIDIMPRLLPLPDDDSLFLFR